MTRGDVLRSLAGLLVALVPATAAPQSVNVPLTPDGWTASDSIKFESYLGRPSLYINRGAALAKNIELESGTIEYDVAATMATNFVGVAFHARSPTFTEVVFFRARSSGTSEAVQYAPALNSLGAAWQVYHGPDANAVATIPRERWIHVRVELDGPRAQVYFDTATVPTLTVPRLAGTGGDALGVWTGAFGRGAYFSNIRYRATPSKTAEATPSLRAGTISSWEISSDVAPSQFTPTALPDLSRLTWERVSVEANGVVLVNRYRASPNGGLPTDGRTGELLVDSVMTGRIPGSKIVYARTIIVADKDGLRRMHFGYSDGAVVYANGEPLAFAMNPQGLRDNLGIMSTVGDAVYLRLKRGRNEIVFAVIEVGGGWAFWARLDPL